MRVGNHGIFFLTLVLFSARLCAESPVPTQAAVADPPTHGVRSAPPLAIASPSIDWVTSYNEARSQGTTSERPVMLFVTMAECRYCVKMQRDSFDNQNVAQEVSDSFVPAKLYLDPKSKLGESLKITIFPTTMFIAPDGNILGYVRGYVPCHEFQAELLAAKSANAERLRVARVDKATVRK